MTAAVFDFKAIAARVARREPEIICAECNGAGWRFVRAPPGGPSFRYHEECQLCHNPKRLPSP